MKLSKGLFISLPIILVSCANTGIYGEIAENLSRIFKQDADIPEEVVSSVPYASMQVRLGNSDNALIVLEEDRGNFLKWTSSNLLKIYTQEGLIVKFSGLENSLDLLELDKEHPILTKKFSGLNKKTFTSFYSFKNPNLYRLPVSTEIIFLGEEEVTILDKKIKTKKYQEKALKNLINWKFKNIYWVTEDGLTLVKAIQNITPRNPKVFYKTLKKYKKPE